MSVRAPEVTDQGLALWRLHRPPDQHLRCLVGTYENKLVLAIRAEGKMLLVESHADITALMQRADTMRESYLKQGWEVYDSPKDDAAP